MASKSSRASAACQLLKQSHGQGIALCRVGGHQILLDYHVAFSNHFMLSLAHDLMIVRPQA